MVVTPEQMIIILNELDTPETRLEWTLALVHAATALRPEEAIGLKWMDIDWHNGRSISAAAGRRAKKLRVRTRAA
jgi:integrase